MPKRKGDAQNKLDKEHWLVGETGPKNRSGKKKKKSGGEEEMLTCFVLCPQVMPALHKWLLQENKRRALNEQEVKSNSWGRQQPRKLAKTKRNEFKTWRTAANDVAFSSQFVKA